MGTDLTLRAWGGDGQFRLDTADQFSIGGGNYLNNIGGEITVIGEAIGKVIIDDRDDKAGDVHDNVFGAITGAVRDEYTIGEDTFQKSETFVPLFPPPIPEKPQIRTTPQLTFRRVREVSLEASGSAGDFVLGNSAITRVEGIAIGHHDGQCERRKGRDICCRDRRKRNIGLRGGDGVDTFRITEPPNGDVRVYGGDPTLDDVTPDRGDRLFVTGTMDQEIAGEHPRVPEDPGSGTLNVVDGGSIQFYQLEPVTLSDFAKVTFVTGLSQDDVVLDSPQPGQSRIRGTTDGVEFESLTFFDVPDVVIDLGHNDGLNPDDSFTVMDGGYNAAGLQSLTVDMGAGNQQVRDFDGRIPLTVIGDNGTTHQIAVTNTEDAGPGSLRYAIEAANALAGSDDAESSFASPKAIPDSSMLTRILSVATPNQTSL